MRFFCFASVAYDVQFNNGEVDVHSVHMVVALKTALEGTCVHVCALSNSRNCVCACSWPNQIYLFNVVERSRISNGGELGSWNLVTEQLEKKGTWYKVKGERVDEMAPLDNDVYASDIINAASCYIESHQRAQKSFKTEFCYGQALSDMEIKILEESEAQIEIAKASIFQFRRERRQKHIVHQICTVLLHNAADYVAELNAQGLLLDQETEHYLEEIEHDLRRK